MRPVPEFSNPDTAVPLIIIGVCLMLMIITWAFTPGRKTTKTVAASAAAPAPIVGQTQVTQAQLGIWHRAHGDSVKQWIENHERVLKQVSDGGMAIDLNADLTGGHDDLGPAIDDAIAKHPAPQMRAQLSALVLASRNTIDALRRSNWTNAERGTHRVSRVPRYLARSTPPVHHRGVTGPRPAFDQRKHCSSRLARSRRAAPRLSLTAFHRSAQADVRRTWQQPCPVRLVPRSRPAPPSLPTLTAPKSHRSTRWGLQPGVNGLR